MNLKIEGNETALEEADLIVAAVPGKSGHTLCIYARDGEKIKQLGLINEFSARASSVNPVATMDAFFDSLPDGSSKEVTESRQRSIDLLTKAGCCVRHLEKEDKK